MPILEILNFNRARSTCVENVDEETLRSSCRLQDTLMDAMVEIDVKLPDLEISGVRAEVRRANNQDCFESTEALNNVIGIRVGPGVLKIIKGLIGEDFGCPQLTFMVEECCHGIILAFTKDTLALAPKDQMQLPESYREMVRANIRLYNRCAAFAPGSSMVEGIEPPK